MLLEEKFVAASFWNCFSQSYPQNNKGLFINQLSLIRLISSFFVSFFPFIFYLFWSLHTLPQASACSLIFSMFIKQKSYITYGEVHTHSCIFSGWSTDHSEMVKNLYPVLIVITHDTDTQLYSQLECAPNHFARHRFNVDTKERKEWAQRVSRMLFKMEKRGKAKIMKEKIKGE